MQYHPKLKKAKKEIEEILAKYDIGALVVLHTPGFGESILRLQPSYAGVEIACDDNVTMAVLLKNNPEHYGGDKQKRDLAVNNAVNMLDILAGVGGQMCLNLMNVLDVWEQQHQIDRTPITFTSDQQQQQ